MNIYGDTGLPLCANGSAPTGGTFKTGMDGVHGILAQDMRQRLKRGGYTHVMFMAMGWYNDQRVSICRYREIAKQVGAAMAQHGTGFHPLVVGMTWPSSWAAGSGSKVVQEIGHISSVLNKATDSDEAGILYGNIILNRVIPHANTADLPEVVIGHSMGTRLGGQAVFGRDLLKQGPEGGPATLAVFLQPAHSAYRYTQSGGNEGNPFYGAARVGTRVVVTTAYNDRANPVAFWSPYVGGLWGMWLAKSKTNSFHSVEFGDDQTQAEAAIRATPPGKVMLAQLGFLTKHGDILSDGMGRFIAALIRGVD